MVIFFVAFLTGIIQIPLNNIFAICLAFSIIGVTLYINLMKNRARVKFLKKIDIFNYREEFDAL